MTATARAVLERVAQTAAPVYSNDPLAELNNVMTLDSTRRAAAQSVLCAPLALGAETIGAIIASARRPGNYADADADVAATVASLLAAALKRIERARQDEFKRRRGAARDQEESLPGSPYDDAAQSSADLEGVIQSAVDALWRAVPASFVVLRHVPFGRPEAVVRAWARGNNRPSLEIQAPVSKAERAAYTEQRPVSVEDVRTESVGDPDLRPLVEGLGARAIHFSPTISDGQVLATVALIESDAPKRWSPDEKMLLARFSESVAPLVLNAQLSARSRSHIEELLTLFRLAGEVMNESELDRCLHATLDSWSRVAGADASALLRWDEEAQVFRPAAMKHLPAGLLERFTEGVPLTDALCGLAATRRADVVADLAGEARFSELFATVRWSGIRGAWATPIIGAAGKLFGMLITFSRVVTEPRDDEHRLADLFARAAAIAMQLREQRQKESARAELAKHLEEELRHSEQHKTEFMYIISHELRTPLNAIIGYAQMLKDGFSGELSAQQGADVQTIIEAGDRLLRMVEDALDLARIDAQRFPVYMDTVAFEDVIRRAISAVHSTADTKGVDINFKIAEDAPVVRTDPERVRQILTNLLSNAVKFTQSGSVEVSVQRAEAGDVQINVTDTGVGFDTTSFPNVFDDFRPADASSTRAHGGAGLGLAISKRLVQRLGGHIGAASEPGEGTTFWFRLPPEIPGADV